MAVPALHTASASATNATSYATASVTIPANSIAFAFVASETGTPTPTLIDANRTWTLHESQAHPLFGALYLFRSLVTTQTIGAVTIDFGATTVANCTWVIASKDNVPTTGTNGADAIGLVTKGSGSSATPTVNFGGAFSNASHPTIGAFLINSNFRTLAAGSGWTELSRIEESVEDVEILVQYKLVEDSSVEATVSASADSFAAIAFEVNTLPEPVIVVANSIAVVKGAQSATVAVGVVGVVASPATVLITSQTAAASAVSPIDLTPNSAVVVFAAQPAVVLATVTVAAELAPVAVATHATVEQLYAEAAQVTLSVWPQPAGASTTAPAQVVSASEVTVAVTPQPSVVAVSTVLLAASVVVAVDVQPATAEISSVDLHPIRITYQERSTLEYRERYK